MKRKLAAAALALAAGLGLAAGTAATAGTHAQADGGQPYTYMHS